MNRREFLRVSALGGFAMLSVGSPVAEEAEELKAIPNPEWENATPIHFVWHPGCMDEFPAPRGKWNFRYHT